ncbi:MAG: acyl-CoA dehydrogenase family protein [Rhodocyclaceae bacterium]|nr:acyl-CoA dehydrogenase family protein [Rhodocyclaceae bacterium]
MDFGLSDEQQAIKEVAARFGREKLAPYYMQRERENGLDRALLREMAGLGFMGMGVPVERGGMALDCVTRGIVTEEIAYHDFNVAYLMLLGSLMGELLCEHAQPEVVEEWLPRVVAGEALVALGLTEPRGGSDAANLALKAEREGDEYVLSGEKTSITFSDQADLIILFARTGKPEQGARGVSAFLVPLDLPGITRTRFNDVGTKLIGRGSVFFDQVRIPAINRMGDEGRGFVQVMQAFDFSRILLGLQCLGAAQASLDEAWAYTKERQAFGAPIAQYQGVTFPLAEADTLMSAARTLCYRGLWLRDQRLPHTAEAAMCKWWPPKLAYEVIHQCLLTHGHYGYTMDLPHQQRMRDVLGLQIGDGTAQIMKLVIARERVGRIAVQYAG